MNQKSIRAGTTYDRNGTLSGYIIVRHDRPAPRETVLHFHREEAIEEAIRLCKKEEDRFNIYQLVLVESVHPLTHPIELILFDSN